MKPPAASPSPRSKEHPSPAADAAKPRRRRTLLQLLLQWFAPYPSGD